MRLFDTHFHFYEKDGRPEEYMAAIKAPELGYLMAVGSDLEESRVARGFAHAIDNSWYSAGVHPHASADLEDIHYFDEFIEDEKLKAIGEIGLDYFYDNAERDIQRKVMEKFLEKALECELPVLIHCRDKQDSDSAYLDVHEMLKDFVKCGGTFELHCFTGTPFWLEKYIELGGYFGVGGIVTFPAAKNVREVVYKMPLDKIILETDSPYLAPVPYRGKPNNPGYIIETAKKVAELKKISIEECAKITTSNAFIFFGIEEELVC